MTAAEQIREMVVAADKRESYLRGVQDGALGVLAPALGVEAPPGTMAAGSLLGLRFRLSIEWLDGEPPADLLVLARRLTAESLERQRQHRQVQ